jgi:hypothetical protein
MRAARALFTPIVLVGVMSACTKEREPFKSDLVQVTGTVKLDDKPLNDAEVTFTPTGSTKGFGAMGKTDASGKYNLKTPHGHDGVLPGEYKVSVSKQTEGSPRKQLVPANFSSPGTTTLKLTVPPGGGTLDIPLKSK